MDSSTTPAFCNPTQSNFSQATGARRLRVHAVGSLWGWRFYVSDDESSKLLAMDSGPLPKGFKFDKETATLFSLSRAAAWVDSHLPGAAVVKVCTEPRRKPQREGRRAA